MTVNEFFDELRSLDQNNIGSWPRWAYIGFTALICLVILAVGTWYLVMPKRDELAQVQQQEQALRQEFEAKQKKVSNLDAYRQQLAEMQKRFGELLRQLPSETEVPKLLNDISQTRLASGLEEELFKPRPEVKKDFYAVLPNDLVVTGAYHELGTFVSSVAALPRIVTIEGINIRPIGGGSPGELRMSVTANTYRYLESGGTPK